MRGPGLGRERIAMLVALGLGGLGCVLGFVDEPAIGVHHSARQQLGDLLRVVCTVSLSVTLVLGPGVVWRALAPERRLGLGFVPLPGIVLLVLVGALAWLLNGTAEPRQVCLAIFGPALAGMAAAVVWSGPGDLFDSEERRVLLVVGCVLGLAVGRALWSLGPEGELYGGTISRTLEVGDRSDARISYHVTQLVATGESPYGGLATTLLSPYNFSSRGPLPGLGASPVVLLSGGRPPAGFPDQPWNPFDAEGFQAYRLAMISFAVVAFLALWDLVRRLAGRTGAYLALLLAATTPFLVHEVWFTWPKMLAAAFVLMAAICVIYRRPLQGGLLTGLGYLMHPGALLAAPSLGLIALWPLRGASWKRPRIGQGLLLAAGVAVFLLCWRLANGDHYDQSGFLDYFEQTGPGGAPGVGPWLESRIHSLANTVVPLLLPLADSDNVSINTVYGGSSPGVVHYFFQYWNTLPFGVAIVFFPLLLVGLWRAGRRWPWPVFVAVVVPFVLFTVYWGSFNSGMMREGLQAWTLALFAVIGCEQAASGFGWLRSTPVRVLLALRVVEVLAMAIVPTVATSSEPISSDFALTDTVGWAAMLGFGAALATLVWMAAPPAEPVTERRSADASAVPEA